MSADSTITPAPSARTTVRRKAERGRYDRETVAAILDDGLFAHVGFVGPHGVCVLPMAYARVDDHVYLHGATGNAMLRGLATGADVCVTVTIVDGLVLSRSAFHHSMNYRSVVVVGQRGVGRRRRREARWRSRDRRSHLGGTLRRMPRTERVRAAHDAA